jgi:hypothetical protein
MIGSESAKREKGEPANISSPTHGLLASPGHGNCLCTRGHAPIVGARSCRFIDLELDHKAQARTHVRNF